jgi:tetratricopeptide (TPR) repeat protein
MSLSVAEQEEVRNHLEVVISSPVFRSSTRRAQLLRYLVERTLAGEGDRISEYAIGVDVLGRAKTFDPRSESIVRTEMTRLRQKLKEYYSSAADEAGFTIELPLRSYVPRFVFQHVERQETAPVPSETVLNSTMVPVRRRLSGGVVALVAFGAAAVVLAGAALAIRQAGRRPMTSAIKTTSNTQAHALFLEGSSTGAQATPEAYRKAIALFHEALQKDPSYAAAYLSMAKDEQGLILLMAQSPKRGVADMEAALRKALAVDPNLGEARGLLAELRLIRDWDWPGAEREYRLAITDGSPAFAHMMYGWGLATRGRFSEAHAQLRRAQDLAPVSLDARFFEALIYYIEGRFEEAQNLLRDILKLNPDYLPAHGLGAILAVLERQCDEAAPDIAWFTRQPPMPETKVLEGWESACRQQRAQAEEYLRQAARSTGPGYASPYNIAAGYALLKENGRALDYLEKSAADHEPQILYLKYAPEFTELRADPRYVALERRVGLGQP